MKVPATNRKKALIVIDVQPAYIKSHNEHIIPNIVSLIKQVPYDLYIEAVVYAEKGSLWDIQQKSILPKDENTRTVKHIADELEKYNPTKVLKETRSVFKGEPNIKTILKENGIEELHLVGLETNDCVFATALDSFDIGYPVYVLEECCEAAKEGLRERALELLRCQDMTNNRCYAQTIEIQLG